MSSRSSGWVPGVLAVLALASCTAEPPSATSEPARIVFTPGTDPAAFAARLSDEELVGQVLMPYAYGDDATKVSSGSAAANRKYAGVSTPAEMVKKYHLGGLILMGWSADNNGTTNVDSPAQIRRLTDGLQAASAVAPLLIGTDQEYGTVTRIRTGMVQLPSALALGAAGDPALTERAWRAAGTELAALGINVDFAPDADVLGEQPGGVIGSRSFGSDPAAVSAQVTGAVRGLQGAGVAAVVKHFPGHGHTTTDSHKDLPQLTQSAVELESGDLPPFVAAVHGGVGLVMSGHLDVRAIDPDVPASFSSKVLVDLLRKKLGYTGVVVTDALNMAPAERWPAGEAAVRAINAGNDLLLMPPSLTDAQRGLLDGLRSGQLTRARLVEAATRILALKSRLAGSPRPDLAVVDSAANRDAARAAAAGAITLLRGRCRGALVTGEVRVTATSNADQARQWLEAALKDQGLTVGAGGAEIRLMGSGKTDISPGAAVTVALDTPYVLRGAPGALVATYSSTKLAMESLAAVLAGKAQAPGHSPLPLSGLPRSAC